MNLLFYRLNLILYGNNRYGGVVNDQSTIINNEFVESKSNETMDVINPATGETIDTITFATEEG